MAYAVHTKKTWARILDDIESELTKWGGVSSWRVDTALAPRSSTKAIQTEAERTVALHWVRGGKVFVIMMTRQARAVDNLLVCWLIVEALRLNEARGFDLEIAEVYRQQFPALPAPSSAVSTAGVTLRTQSPYAVLFVRDDAPPAVCEAAYRALAKQAHPDLGGSTDAMVRLMSAIETIRKEKAR